MNQHAKGLEDRLLVLLEPQLLLVLLLEPELLLLLLPHARTPFRTLRACDLLPSQRPTRRCRQEEDEEEDEEDEEEEDHYYPTSPRLVTASPSRSWRPSRW